MQPPTVAHPHGTRHPAPETAARPETAVSACRAGAVPGAGRCTCLHRRHRPPHSPPTIGCLTSASQSQKAETSASSCRLPPSRAGQHVAIGMGTERGATTQLEGGPLPPVQPSQQPLELARRPAANKWQTRVAQPAAAAAAAASSSSSSSSSCSSCHSSCCMRARQGRQRRTGTRQSSQRAVGTARPPSPRRRPPPRRRPAAAPPRPRRRSATQPRHRPRSRAASSCSAPEDSEELS